ncbi:hypothetical protein, partial [Frankia sp. AvcI1]
FIIYRVAVAVLLAGLLAGGAINA